MLPAHRQTHKESRSLIKATPNKSLDVRAKQLLCLVSCPLNSNGLGGGFAPRHLNRCAFSGN
jgi:hypothetical protein